VYHFRPFRNSDPPRLAEIWRSQPPQRGMMQPVSAGLLEQFVFSKPYFDREGLIVAVHDGVPVGFVHAGFGPNDQHTSVSTDDGTVYMLLLRNDHRDPALADELLSRGEAYLRDRGAKVLYAGGIHPINGFYLGIYGGSELPGVLATDPMLPDACRRNHYREIDQVVVLRRDLGRFRLPISREQRQLRREVMCVEHYTPLAADWWEACTMATFERLRFGLRRYDSDEMVANVWFWDIEPLSSSWGIPTAGMYDLYVAPDWRRHGYATYLLGEAFYRLRARGIMQIEAQTMRTNTPAVAMYQKNGFAEVDHGMVFRKE
jgi:ribosomal protein S18 acetylase RimI-like enzyme